MRTEFWVLFPIPARQFLTKARLILRTGGIVLMPLSYAHVAALRSDSDMEIPVTLNRRTCPVRVNRDGTLIQVAVQVDIEGVDSEELIHEVPNGVLPTARNYANRLLDIARFVTDDAGITRLGQGYPDVDLVIRPGQHGLDPLVCLQVAPRPEEPEEGDSHHESISQTLQSAIGKDEVLELPLAQRSLSQGDVELIRSLCADESALPAWDYLLSTARYSFFHGGYREALLNSHTAIESRVDNRILVSLSEKGLSGRTAEDFLSDTSFKQKLTVCLPALCGVRIDAELRDRILNLHGRRNDVTHLGAQVFHREASGALSTAKKALAALQDCG